QSIEKVKWFKMREEQTDPERRVRAGAQRDLGASSARTYTDFSQGPEPFSLLDTDPRFYGEFLNRVDDKAIKAKLSGKNIYEITFKNQGGLVMPVIVKFEYKDGSSEIERLPAEIWRFNEKEVTKVFVKEKEVLKIILDPNLETTDINTDDNVFPRQPSANRFDEMRRGR
ncbi:MAG TPA: M1 family peptidase, partial [Cyclobacteriaceae bacterium]|nr:M1 family peptidase [Cyclobacteriaceae bacterium]